MKHLFYALLAALLPTTANAGEAVTYSSNGAEYEGYRASASGQSKGLVLIIHDWDGLTEYEVNRAEMLAKKGYDAFAVDLYGKGNRPVETGAKKAETGKLYNDRDKMRSLILAGLTEARKKAKSKAVVMGYCFGGMCVLELARAGSDALGVISIHGIFSPGDVPNESITSKILCLHGQDDPMVPPEQVLDFENEMSSAGADWQVHAYGGTMHAFTNPAANDPGFGTVYNPVADKRASQSIENFFNEVFA